MKAALSEVWEMAHREADTGAPAGMVATYVELALRHIIAGHDGMWMLCGPCHDTLNDAV